jgi:hypothetical protein
LKRPLPIGGFDPGSLRLNLQHIKELGMALDQGLNGA